MSSTATPETLEAILDALGDGPRTVRELMGELGYSKFKIGIGVNQLERERRIIREEAAIASAAGRHPALWRIRAEVAGDTDSPDEAMRKRGVRRNERFLAELRKHEGFPANRMLREGNPVFMRGLPTGGQSSIALCSS